MPIAEVVKNVGAITILGVTELDYLAQLATLERGAAFDIGWCHPKLRRGNAVQHHDAASAPVLTQREREILALLADGFGNKQIAARLGISTNTVKTHLELLFDKLDVSTRTEAVTAAARMGLLLL